MSAKIKSLSVGDFDKFVEKENVVVDFYADWCGPCKIMAPNFEKAAEEVKDVKFAKVNIDNNQELAERFGVMSIPTTLFLKKGNVSDQAVGALSKEDIIARAKKAF